MTDERDDAAEAWLLARHSPDWYIGDATAAEWDAAYAASVPLYRLKEPS